MSFASRPCHHRANLEAATLRDGRLRKVEGQALSHAPAMGTVLTFMATGSAPDQVFASTCGDGAAIASDGSLSAKAEFFIDPDMEFGLDQGATALADHTGFRVRF